MATCPNGHENPEGQPFCGQCGASVADAGPATPDTEAAGADEAHPSDATEVHASTAAGLEPGEVSHQAGSASASAPQAPTEKRSRTRHRVVGGLIGLLALVIVAGAVALGSSGGGSGSDIASTIQWPHWDSLAVQYLAANCPVLESDPGGAVTALGFITEVQNLKGPAKVAFPQVISQLKAGKIGPAARLCAQAEAAGELVTTTTEAPTTTPSTTIAPTTTTTAPPPPPPPVGLTLQTFNQIQNGMSYQQVASILGSPGTQSAETNLGGYDDTIYMWTANGGLANANVEFQNGVVVSKAQAGLGGF